jgi:hypothetical protein
VTYHLSSERLTITIPRAVIDRLRARGARSDRSRGPLNYTRQLARALELFDAIIARSDPRATRGLPEEQYELILNVLAAPQELDPFHIHLLGDYLLDLPDFVARARQLAVDPTHLAATITAYPFAEKLHLVDTAQIRNASRPLQATTSRTD